jgi:hypothetical protein
MQSWSADGHLVSFVPLINRLQVRKDGPRGEIVTTATLPGSSATHLFQINGQQYRLTKTAAFVPVIDLERVGAGFVPESLEFHQRVPAPAGATCPEHSGVAASVAMYATAAIALLIVQALLAAQR